MASLWTTFNKHYFKEEKKRIDIRFQEPADSALVVNTRGNFRKVPTC